MLTTFPSLRLLLWVSPSRSAGGNLLRDFREGRAVVNGGTAAISAGDAVPVRLREAHAFENSASEDLELMVIESPSRKASLILRMCPWVPNHGKIEDFSLLPHSSSVQILWIAPQ